ncbi:P-loop NTPase fold protein [Amycolatopsis sp. NPDC051758]|uniref:P-loop NTPase fold protein n=1 Tax=Amycolatopsis sp. NPDC051758 TaxID=3363935 RepID=UPI00378D4FD9
MSDEPPRDLGPSVLQDWNVTTSDDFELWTAALALEVMLDNALADPDLRATLRTEGLRAEDAKAVVLSSESTLARVRMAQDEYARQDHIAPRRPRVRYLGPAKILWLGAAVGLTAAYLSCFVYSYSALSWPLAAMGVGGLGGVVAMSGRIVVRRVPELFPVTSLGEVGRIVPHDDLIGLGSRLAEVQAEIVVPAIQEFIRRNRKLTFGTKLIFREVTGLYQELGANIIQTAATRRLTRVLDRADSVAVALAGNRGVGKTTAIKSITSGLHSSGGSPTPFLVLASAPANYEARDFVLHLHALLCRAVLDKVGHPSSRGRRRLLRTAFDHLTRIVVHFAFAAAVSMLLWGSPNIVVFGREIADLLRRASGALPGSLSLLTEGQSVVRLTALAILALVPVHLGLVLVTALVRTAFTAARDRTPPGITTLRKQAKKHLDQIRFLQTYTTGWSGKLNLPLKGEAGRTWSTQRAEQQLTHPEVVDKFREFATSTARQLEQEKLAGLLVVAIDELDKIGEPEKAHQFINDIKAIFDVPGCLFFVSVSDDAVLNFEKRGLAVRDAFDSAFTEMIRVEHFTLEESRLWITLRLPELPEQFGYLCHCLSGGLPRDLRRYTIEMVDIANEIYHPTLETVTRILIGTELRSKAHALAGMADMLPPTDEVTRLSAALLHLKEVDHSLELVEFSRRICDPAADVDPDNPVERLRRHAACFALLCATVLDVFTDDLAETGLGPDLHLIALARQRMALHPKSAVETILTVRKTLNLDISGPADEPPVA